MKKCPKCGGTRFIITALFEEKWTVNENGEWLETICDRRDCVDKADDDDEWECAECHYQAPGIFLNVPERLDKLDKVLFKERLEREEKARIEKEHKDSLCKKIIALRPRIQELIKIGNAVQESKKMPGGLYTNFYATPQMLGFIKESPIEELGYDASMTRYSFHTNGDKIYEYDIHIKDQREASTEHLEMFLSQFDGFEKRFYDWFDKEFDE